MALSGSDLTNLRAGNDSVALYLSIVKQTSFATALINQSSFTVPLAQLTVDTTSAEWLNVRAGMTVWVGSAAGLRDVGVFRVRKTPIASTLYIAETSVGDPGMLALKDLSTFADDQYITIINDYNIWSVASRISGTTFFKDYDTAYTTQNATTPPCPLNIGPHVADFIDTGTSVITVSMTATISGFLSETISTVLWDIDDGSYTSGSSSTAAITATFPAGYRVVTCDVTLSTSATLHAERAVWAHDTSSNAPNKIRAVNGDRRNREGREMTLVLDDDSIDTTIPDGAMCIVWEVASWNGNDITSATKQFVGWTSPRDVSQVPGEVTNTVTVKSAYLHMKNMIAYSQQLVEASSPAHWQEAVAGLTHASFFAFYLLYWQTTLAHLFDVDFKDFSGLPFNAWMVNAGNIPAQMEQVTGRLSAWVGQASDGEFFLRDDYDMMTSANQAGETAIMTMTGQDISSISISERQRPPVSRVEATAFSYSSSTATALLSHAPGTKGGQGAVIETLDNMLVASQSLLNDKAAQWFAKANNPYESITVVLERNYDFFEPVRGDILTLDLSGVSDWPETGLQSFTVNVLEVSKSYSENGTAQITLTVSAAVSVTAAGDTITIPVSDSIPGYDETTNVFDIEFSPFDSALFLPGWEPFSIPTSEAVVFTLLSWADGGLAASKQLVTPAWTVLDTPDANYVIENAVIDLNSTYLDNPATGTLEVYRTDYNSTTEQTQLLYSADALATSPVFSTQQTLSDRYFLLRDVFGVSGGVALYGRDLGAASGTYTDGFTAALGAKSYFTSADRPFGFYVTNQYNGNGDGNGVRLTSGGRTDAPCIGVTDSGAVDGSGNTVYEGTIVVDFGEPVKVTAAEFWYKFPSAEDAKSRALAYYDADQVRIASQDQGVGSSPSYVRLQDPTDRDDVRYVVCSISQAGGSDTSDGLIDDISIDFENESGTMIFTYSSDNGVSVNTRAFGIELGGTGGMDVDDFNLGIMIAAASDGGQSKLYHTNGDYTAAPAIIAGIASGVAAEYNLVRIPFLKSGGTPNNVSTSFEFIYGTNKAVSGATLWRATWNASTNTVSGTTDITPIISAVTYRVLGSPNSLEVFGGNASIIVAIAQDESDSGGTVQVIRTTDGGATWSIVDSFDGVYVYHAGSTEFWVSGTGGIEYTGSAGTLSARAGDFTSVVDAFPTLGVIAL